MQTYLKLNITHYRQVVNADQSTTSLAIAGPVLLMLQGKQATVDAWVLPEAVQPLLGKHALTALGLHLDSTRQELVVNPAHPLRPQFVLK